MFRAVVRAVNPTVIATRTSVKSPTLPLRAFSTSLRVSSGPPPPQLFGTGGKAGTIPSALEQATGLERLQLLGDLNGIDVFDESPLDASRIGTKADPILVPSYDSERIIGCTGFPADSHDVLWFNVAHKKQARCTECGSVYALNFHGEDHVEEHHH